MAETIIPAKKVGGSLMVRIPSDIAAQEGINEGDDVRIEFKKIKRDWFGCTPGLTPFNKEKDRARSKYE